MRKDIDRVVHQETQVTDARLICLQQAVTNTGFVDIDADVVLVRVLSCLLDGVPAEIEIDIAGFTSVFPAEVRFPSGYRA